MNPLLLVPAVCIALLLCGTKSAAATIQSFDITLNQPVGSGLPGPGAGILETPGSTDSYRVAIAAGQTVYFDEQTGLGCSSNLRWRLADPDGVQIFDESFAAVDQCGSGGDVGKRSFTKTGSYTVTVYAVAGGTDTYAFTLWTVEPQTFPLAVDQAVSNGTPLPGAGHLETPGATDVYTLQASAGQTVYFDEQSDFGCSTRLRWRLTDPEGVLLFDDVFAALEQCGSGGDKGLWTFAKAGKHILTVYGVADGVGPYAFRVWSVQAQTFAIAIGQPVADQVPQVGAGNIETPGTTDQYTFQAAAGQRVYFDEQTGAGCGAVLRWRLTDPEGVLLFDDVFAALEQCASGGDKGMWTFAKAGQHTLTVYGVADGVGPYAFRVWPVTAQSFPLAIGDAVSNGVPSAGSGNIEIPGATDQYTFQAAAGQKVYFDEQTGAGCGAVLRWRLTDPEGVVLFDDVFAALEQCGSGGDKGLWTFAKTGNHTLTVYGVADGVGSYAFEIWPVTAQSFPLAIGDPVSNGLPSAGSGNIESPGATDQYTFQAAAGQKVYFDEQTGAGCGAVLRWRLTDPEGVVLFDDVFAAVEQCGSGGDKGLWTFAKAGKHTLTVYGVADGVGLYAFRIWSVEAQSFSIAIGQPVSDQVPQFGSGNIETPGTTDQYTFQAAAGQKVYFDEQTGAGCGAVLRWRLTDPEGVVLFDDVFAALEQCGSGGDKGLWTFAKTGNHTLTVYGVADGVGTYALEIWPETNGLFDLPLGGVVSPGVPAAGAGVLEVPGSLDAYVFQVQAGQRYYFDELSGAGCSSGIRWRLVAPSGAVVFDDLFAAEVQCGSGGSIGLQALAETGLYRLAVYGHADTVGEYRFAVYPVSNPTIAPVGDIQALAGSKIEIPLVAAPAITRGLPLRYHLVNGPAGALLGTNNGTFVWQVPADTQGSFTASVRVSDALGGQTDVLLKFNISTAADLVITSIQPPPSASAGESLALRIRELNQGGRTASGPWRQRVWISSDTFLDSDDSVAAEVSATGALASGESVERSVRVTFPEQAGTYYLIAQTDLGSDVPESNEGNNLAISAPVQVFSSYAVTVHADVETAPANTVIALTGAAALRSGGPAAAKPVLIEVVTRGTHRRLQALTDLSGAFALNFVPLFGEAGHYTVGAAHPGADTIPPQDAFDLVGLSVTPSAGSLIVPANGSVVFQARLKNRSERALTAVSIKGESVSTNAPFKIKSATLGTLAAGQEILLPVVVESTTGLGYAGSAVVQVTSAEGARGSMSLQITLTPSGSHLVANPDRLTAGVRRTNQTLVQFELRNDGGLATGPLRVLLPPLPWLTAANPLPLPALAPGAIAQIALVVNPPSDFPLGEHTGSIVVTDGTDGVNVPFRFTTLSSSKGSLAVEPLDELTYYAEGAPKVSGARVIVFRHGTVEEIARQTTGQAGRTVFTQLNEGFYDLEISAPQHSTFRGTVSVLADSENLIQPFLSRETVRYEFSVVPATVEDRSRVRLETIFETVVPLPVVTVEPNVIELADLQSDRTEIELRVTNHGLIAAQGMRLRFASNARWRFTPLQSELGDLGARSSVTVPLLIERLGASGQAPAPGLAATGGESDCGLGGEACWNLICGKGTNSYCAPILVPMGCYSFPEGSYLPPRFGADGGPGPYGTLMCSCTPLPCDPCAGKIGQALFDFGLPLVLTAAAPVFAGPAAICLKDGGSCYASANNCATNAACDQEKLGIDCAAAAISCGAIVAVAAGATALETPLAILGLAAGLAGLGKGIADACKEAEPAQGPPMLAEVGTDPTFFPGQAQVRIEAERLQRIVDAYEAIFGSPVWVNPKLGTNFAAFTQSFSAAVDRNGASGQRITAEEASSLLRGPLPEGVSGPELTAFIARWNRTLEYNARGIYQRAQLPAGESADFLALDVLATKWAAARAAIEEMEANGHVDDLFGGMRQALQKLQDALSSSSGGVCARVKLRLDQDAVTTRSAFRAQLDLENNAALPLTGVKVELHITSVDGVLADGLFGLSKPELSGIQSVDGSGVVESASVANVQWVIVPGHQAAPSPDPALYFLGGYFTYEQEGKRVRVPLAPTPITVYPTPRLSLTYFHERDVLGDDPATDAVEPSVPYSLAVIAKNSGFGVAKQFRIESSQPQIIENEKGLLIDFNLIGSEVNGSPFTPTLNADFGDLAPSAFKVARWLFTSSLQGQFIDYKATVENIGPLKGFPELATVESVSVHELIHTVLAEGLGVTDDGAPDFLVNDIQDDEFLPDHLYQSNGTTNTVNVVTSGQFDGAPSAGDLEVRLSTALPAGWAYIRLPDPGAGNVALQRVVRGDGTEVRMGANAWTTDRTFIAGGRRPRYEHRLHLFDRSATAGTRDYRLIYAIPSSVDSTPPTSGMIRVQASSRPTFALEWFGGDNPGGSGIASFDVYVSVNGAAYAPWIEKTSLKGALFTGEAGSRYAFYTVATDKAGNRETPPSLPDTETVVNRANTAPTLTVSPDVTVSEGETITLFNSASDPDFPADALVFSLGAGAPPGMVIDPLTGTVTWRTSEASGPSTNRINVMVTDDGIPSRSDSKTIQVVVREFNTAPVVDLIEDVTLQERQLLEFRVGALDFDLPAQMLRFSLGAGAPVGAIIDPFSGIFRWRPSDIQGPSTNQISVSVSDGVTSTRRDFQVTVRDTRADFELSLGSAVVKAGGMTNVPMTVAAGVDVVEFSGRIRMSQAPPIALSLEGLSQSVGAATIQQVEPGAWLFKMTAVPGQSFQGSNVVAQLLVVTPAGDRAGSFPLEVEALSGMGGDSTRLSSPRHQNGHLIVLGRQPVLGVIAGSSQLRLYANPGDEVLLEGTSEINGDPSWSSLIAYKMSGPSLVIDPLSLPRPGAHLFLRAILKP